MRKEVFQKKATTVTVTTPTTTAATTTTDGDVVGDVTVQEQSVDVGGRPTRNAHRRPRCSFLEKKKQNKNLKEPLDFKPINCFYIKLNFIITVLAVWNSITWRKVTKNSYRTVFLLFNSPAAYFVNTSIDRSFEAASFVFWFRVDAVNRLVAN